MPVPARLERHGAPAVVPGETVERPTEWGPVAAVDGRT